MRLLDIVKKGSTDRSVSIEIIDSGDGTPETGVVYNTSGIDLWYRREGAAVVSITEATLAGLTTSHTDGGFLHIANGSYRLDLPDAAFATGANHVDVGGTVTGMIVIGGRVRLVDYDPEDAVRAGLTALPNANAASSGGLPTSGTGSHQITLASGLVTANVTQFGGSNGTFSAGRPEVNTTHAAGTAWNSGAITAGSFGSDSITSTALAASAVSEIWASVADSSGVTTLLSRLTATRAGYLDNLSSAPPSAATIADAVWDELLSGHAVSGSAGEALSSAGGGSSPTDIAEAVWDLATSGHTDPGSFGAAMAAAGSAGDPWTADLSGYSPGEAGYLLHTSIDAAISSRMATFTLPTNFSSLGISAGGVASADVKLWRAGTPGNLDGNGFVPGNLAAINGNTGRAGTFADSLDAGQLANPGDAMTLQADSVNSSSLAASAVTEIWAAVVDSSGVGTLLSRLSATRAGYLDNLSAGAVALAADLAGLMSDVGDLTTDVAGLGTDIAGVASSIAGLNDISAADVLTQVNAALDANLTLPGQAIPVTTPSIRTALAQLFQQGVAYYEEDSDEQRIFNPSGSTVLQKRAVSDDGTTTVYGALVAGP